MSLVQELQREAIGSQVPTSELLRKALVVARKLSVQDFTQWIEWELKGYPANTPLPSYREVRGELKCFNPFYGWQHVQIFVPGLEDVLTKHPFDQPIGEAESLVAASHKQTDSTLSVALSAEKTALLYQSLQFNDPHPRPLALHTSATQIGAIIDAVRSAVLEWSLKLEEDGITGEGLSFSREEKQMAAQNNYHIENFIGAMHGSQIQQKTSNSTQNYTATGFDTKALETLLQGLNNWLPSAPISSEEREEIAADLETVRSQAASPKPKSSILSAALSSIKSVLESAATRALSEGLTENADEIGQWIGQLGGAAF